MISVRPTFIECPNVKGCHTVGPKGLAHRVSRSLKQPRSLNCKSFWKISTLTHPFSLYKTSARVWRSIQVQVSSTSVSRSCKLVLEPSLSKLFSWFMSGLTVWIQSSLLCHCFSSYICPWSYWFRWLKSRSPILALFQVREARFFCAFLKHVVCFRFCFMLKWLENVSFDIFLS